MQVYLRFRAMEDDEDGGRIGCFFMQNICIGEK